MPQPHTLDGSTIPLALEQLNKHKDDGDQSAASDYSSYTAMSNNWRPTNSNAIPTEQELQDALDALETSSTGGYANSVRAERDRRLAEVDYACMRHRDETANGDPTTLSTTGDNEWGQLLDYKRQLRDLPANIVAGPAGTYGTFIAPIWPTKPSFV